jgi:hypothetical protein
VLVAGEEEDHQASRGHSSMSLGKFDNYLPCHSLKIASSSSSRTDIERAGQHPVAVICCYLFIIGSYWTKYMFMI